MSIPSVISKAVDDIHLNGYAVIPNALSAGAVERIRKALTPWLRGEHLGRNDFEGHKTERVYALLAKTPEVAAVVEHEVVLGINDALLPKNYLLSAVLAINLHPGETPQRFHLDGGDSSLPVPRPHPPIGVSAMWAFDDFTDSNGATEVIPGSHAWDDTRQPTEGEAVTVTMPAGSVLVFGGNLLHRGGANVTGQCRLGISPQYCPPYLRQLENMTLAVPPATAAQYSERVQALLGYSVDAPGFRGHVDGRHPRLLIDPEYQGRKYRDDLPKS
jgi:ectoine hydroxylase-related dioxygenase (phytanoyl-CoA dioxygenase family)